MMREIAPPEQPCGYAQRSVIVGREGIAMESQTASLPLQLQVGDALIVVDLQPDFMLKTSQGIGGALAVLEHGQRP